MCTSSIHRAASWTRNAARVQPTMDFPSPLVIQELIDHCLDFLHDSPHDLRACALVCRSWATSAQIHLFSTVSVGYFGFCNNRRSCHLRCSRLFDILDASPRLVRYVKCMEIFLNCVPDETIELISTVPFTHLRRITVAGSCSGVRVISVIQKLLGVGSLRDIAIWASFDSAEDFSQVLQDCSPHVEALYFRHVRVKAIQRHRYTSTYSTTSGPDKIKISTLGLVDALPVNDWLEEPQSPFDFSEVRRLSVYSAQTLPPWKFLTGIEHLENPIGLIWRHYPTSNPSKRTPNTALMLTWR
ncbi:hypothetical protein B0H11DRAFT_2052354 [Mycena galericulata]|nr:hypothetical protein B0H11DRAFT_2052354 [Mycena galericulata]